MKTIKLIVAIVFSLTFSIPSFADILDNVDEQEPIIVKTMEGSIKGIFTEEYQYQMYFYSVCSKPNKCASLGLLSDLGWEILPDGQDHLDSSEYTPGDQGLINVIGTWNIYSDNSVVLDTSKKFEVWSKMFSVKEHKELLEKFHAGKISF